ncbi:MAG: DUF1631 family protein [Pseudomonadota bacterium]
MDRADLPTAMQGTSVFDALLTQCRDLVCGQLDKAIAGMLEKADETLSELATKTQNRETQKLYLEAKDVARTQRAAMEKQFRTSYLGEFKQRANKGKKTGANFADFDPDASSFELSLVADDDLEETLKFNELAAKVRRYCEEEINALDQRVGVLLGDADLQSEENPFSPQAVCDAYKLACRKVVENAEVRSVFLKLFDDHVLDELRSVYKAVNQLLVQNAILPKIRYAVAHKEGGKAPAKGTKDKADKPEADADDEPAGEQDVFAALQKLFAGKAGGGAGAGTAVGGGPVLQGAELLGSLTKLQLDGLAAFAASGGQLAAGAPVTGTTNVLHELKVTEVGASMGQMDAMTLDVVAMLFDQLFDDPKIPLGAKGLIGRMQIPILKVAIADKELFSKKTHPARRLLDTLGEIAIRLPADFNTGSTLFGHLETILQGLVSSYQEDVEIFDIVREQLLTLMARDDARIEKESQSAAERVVQEEALAVAKSVAQEEVRTRVAAAPLPGPVLEFLVEQWLKLMLIIHVKRGPASEAWSHAIEAMDQLIWSVQPKDTSEDRRKLATIVPPLLKRIAAGMEVAGIEHEVREFFFAELMKTHTNIMSAPLKGKGDAPHAPHAAAKANAAAAALDFSSSITVKNPYGGGEVQVSAVDLAADAEHHGHAAKEAAALLDSLKQGDWVEFKEADKEERRPARLIFISPRKTRYIFSDRSEKEYIECTRSEMARRLRSGEATVMEEAPEVPFFERIMGGVVNKMRGIAAAA